MKRYVAALVAALIAVSDTAAEAGDATVSSNRTTPIETATADGVSAGNITITSGGSVTVTAGPAVTLNSNNAVINQGTIEVTSDTGAVAVSVEAGNTSSFTNSGDIDALVESSLGVATGSGNIAFWVSGNGAFIGNLSFTSDSTLAVGGTNSFGVLLDAEVQGTIDIAGALSADGTGTVGFQSNALITGDVAVTSDGSIVASGEAARAAVIAGGIDGAFSNAGAITAGGAQTNVSYDGGAPRADFALGIGGSLTGGLQNTGSITGSSAGMALYISPYLAATPADLTLGVIDAVDLPYGFENEGSISASTARSGEAVIAAVFAGASLNGTDYAVTVEGGVKNTGTISATRTADGSATAFSIGNLASVPAIVNTGSITATASSSATSTAYGLVIEANGGLAAIDNSGTIGATATGLDASATGIIDYSGTLLSLTNSGTISAVATTTDSDTGTTSAIALDLSQAKGGVTLSNSGTIGGNVLLGEHNDVVSLVDDGDDDDETMSVWTGSIDFGGGDDTFAISGAGVFTGSIFKTSGTLGVSVADGTIALGSEGTITATTIDFGSASRLTLTVSAADGTTPRLQASDRIIFASGATIETTLSELVGNGFAAIIARAPTIDASLGSTELVFENLSFLYGAQAQIVNGSEQELQLVFHLKTAAELGLNANEAVFYDSLLDILAVDDNVLAEPFLAVADAQDFAKAYEMLMPVTSQPTLRAGLTTIDDIERSLQDHAAIFLRGDESFDAVNAWWAGSGRAYSLDANALSSGIDGSIVATTFGVDRMFIPWLMVGAELTFAGADMADAGSETDVVRVDTAQGGAYATLSAGPIYVSGSAGAGSTSNHGSRVFKTDDFEATITDLWDGTFVNAAAEAGINAEFGHLIIRPWVGLSWLSLNEEAHQEMDGGTGFNLAYDEMEAEIERAKAGLILAYTYKKTNLQITPEFRASWTQLLSDAPTTVTGSFVDGAVPFTLTAAPIAHDQMSAGLGITIQGQGLAFALGYDAMLADGEASHSGRLELSTQF